MREQPRLTDMIKNTMFDGFLLVRAAQLGGHGNFVVEVGKRAVGIERTGI